MSDLDDHFDIPLDPGRRSTTCFSHRSGFRPFPRMKFQTRGAASWLRNTLEELSLRDTFA